MFMRRDFDLLRINIKSKLFNGVGSLLLCLQLDSACYFIIVFYLYLLHDAFRIFGRNKGSKVEKPLIDVEDIRFDHVFNAA